MTLVDRSVWIDHLRRGSADLSRALLDGELSRGSLGRHAEIVDLLDALPQAVAAEHSEVLRFVETRKLYGRGLGWAGRTRTFSARRC